MRSAVIPSTPLIVITVTALCASARAQTDHTNLEEGLPVRVEDAYPAALGNRDVQFRFSWERTDDSNDRATIEPRVEFGIAPNWQLTIGAPFFAGDADRRGSGDVQIGALYNFNQESLSLPAFAIAGRIDAPTGEDSEGLDTTLKLIMTRTIDDEHFGRFHLNLEWGHNFQALADERDDTFAIIPGYSFRLNTDTIIVADFIREWEMESGHESNIIELGARYQLEPRTVLSVGAGAGIGDDSPDVRVTFGVQFAF